MRTWPIQQLFDDCHNHNPKAKKYLRFVHVCEKCGWKTPEIPPLDFDAKEIPPSPPRTFEIKNKGLCDKCNDKIWRSIINS